MYNIWGLRISAIRSLQTDHWWNDYSSLHSSNQSYAWNIIHFDSAQVLYYLMDN